MSVNFAALLFDAAPDPSVGQTSRLLAGALGISKATVPVAPVAIAEPLRALLDAISDYALQLLAQARRDPRQHEAIAFALAPIDERRAAASRRVIRDDEDDVEAPRTW